MDALYPYVTSWARVTELCETADCFQQTLAEIQGLPETVMCPERELAEWPA